MAQTNGRRRRCPAGCGRAFTQRGMSKHLTAAHPEFDADTGKVRGRRGRTRKMEADLAATLTFSFLGQRIEVSVSDEVAKELVLGQLAESLSQ